MKITKIALGSSLVASQILAGSVLTPSFAVTSAVPSAGLSFTSVAVGAAGVLGGGWKTRLLGYAVGLVDPASATFYDGKIVIVYPENLLTFTGVGWLGNFSNDPSLPVPPVSSDPFFEFDSKTPPSNFLVPANPAINAAQSAIDGVVTITFNAPRGVTSDSATEFNLLAVVFQNTSGRELEWNQVTDTSDSASFFSDYTRQSLTCTPDSTYLVPITCGSDTPSYRYQVSAIPEPLTLLGAGTALAFGTVFKRKLSKRQ